MERYPETIEELKSIVCASSRLKFVTKVLYCLRFTQNHPNYNEQVGCCWCLDGESFLVNSNALGAFLDLKSNSINTNFREHGFQVQKGDKMPPELVEMTNRNWKKRKATIGNFNRNSSIADSDSIGLVDSSKKEQIHDKPVQNQFISIFQSKPKPIEPVPPPKIENALDEFFKNGDLLHQKISIQHMLLEMPLDDAEKNKLISDIVSQWKQTFGINQSVPARQAVENLIPDTPERSKYLTFQMRVNLVYLIFQDPSASSQSIAPMHGNLKFDQFAKFYVRYGHPSNDSMLEQLTVVPQLVYDIDNIDETLKVTNYDDDASFINGFIPHSHKNEITQKVWNSPIHSWAVIHSKTANKFVLYCKSDQILQLYITINIATIGPKNKITVKFGNDIKGSSDWKGLFQLLSLPSDKGLHLAPIEIPCVKEIGADEINVETPKESVQTTPTGSQMFLTLDSQTYQNDSQFSISNNFSFEGWSQQQADSQFAFYD